LKIKFIYPLLEVLAPSFFSKKKEQPNIASVAILKIGDEYNWEVECTKVTKAMDQ